MNRRWTITSAPAEKTEALRQALNIHPTICDLLVQRGIEDFEQARQFFRPDLSRLHSPWLMKDMDKATDRVLTAINNREKILVFGDYDVDGTTAVAVV